MAWTNLVESHQRNISAKLYGNRSNGFRQEDFLSFLYRYIGKISPAPWRPCLLTKPNGLNNLSRKSPKEQFCKIILKSVHWFLTRRFLKFSIQIYRENKPPGGHVFWWIQMAWTILVEDHQRNIPAKLYGNQSSGFRQEDFLSILYRYIGKVSPAPWRPCFLTNPNGLNNLSWKSPKEQFCKIILKSVQWFLTRRFLKFSIQIYRENKPRPLAAMLFDESKWLEQSW